MEIIDCAQGEDDWRRHRIGLPTASNFQCVLSPRAGKEGKTRQTYLAKLAGEIITGEPSPADYTDSNMERGKIMEAEARDLYAYLTRVEPQRIGFIKNHGAGCSPDSHVGDDGGLEIKTMFPHILIGHLLKGEVPTEHYAQVQGNIWISERAWWDFVGFWPGMPMLKVRVQRDSAYIATLADAVRQFNDELAQLVERIRRYGQPEKLAA